MTTKKLKVGDAVSATEDAMRKNPGLSTTMEDGGIITHIHKSDGGYIARVKVIRTLLVDLTDLQQKKKV